MEEFLFWAGSFLDFFALLGRFQTGFRRRYARLLVRNVVDIWGANVAKYVVIVCCASNTFAHVVKDLASLRRRDALAIKAISFFVGPVNHIFLVTAHADDWVLSSTATKLVLEHKQFAMALFELLFCLFVFVTVAAAVTVVIFFVWLVICHLERHIGNHARWCLLAVCYHQIVEKRLFGAHF